MFIGHFGIGLAAKKVLPHTSLGTLFIAVQFLDLLWPNLLLLNLEHAEINGPSEGNLPLAFTDYPISHSLLMTVVWSALFAILFWLYRRDLKEAFFIGLCVASHWITDFIVHIKDLPLGLGVSEYVGLGLWEYPVASALLEGLIFCFGVFLFLRTDEGKNKVKSFGFWSLIGALVIIHLLNIFGPPPSNIESVAWGAQFIWVFIIWGFWIDKKKSRLINRNINKNLKLKTL